MVGAADQHTAAVAEFTQWWEDIWHRGIGSQMVLLAVPSGWGRTSVLHQFVTATTDYADAPLALQVNIAGKSLPDEASFQALSLRDALEGAAGRRRVAELLGVDRLPGAMQLGLFGGAVFAASLAAAVAFMLAALGIGAADKVWDNSTPGLKSAVARAARSLATVSVEIPVLVIIDDADLLEPGLALTLVENLIRRGDGRVLVVAAADPGSTLAGALLTGARGALAGRVHKANADPDMSYLQRIELAATLLPGLPTTAAQRIGQRTRTFADVFAVTSAGRLTEIAQDHDQVSVLPAVDNVIGAVIQRHQPSHEAVAVSWAGGSVHARQAERMLSVLGSDSMAADDGVTRTESLVRLTDPQPSHYFEGWTALSARTRMALATALLEEAIAVAADPVAGPVDRVVALQAAHHVRADVGEDKRGDLLQAQHDLVKGLEKLCDMKAAYDIASTALGECPSGDRYQQGRTALYVAMRQLERAPFERDDPRIEEAVTLAVAGGAVVRLEARLWAATDLLGQPANRKAALTLTQQLITDLDACSDLGLTGDRWRLQLAFHAGRAGFSVVTHQLLAPLISKGDTGLQDAARAVLRAVGGPQVNTWLEITALEAELGAVSSDDDQMRRLRRTLAVSYAAVGEYRQALEHARWEFGMRRRVPSADQSGILDTRTKIAFWTGQSGDAPEALRLSQELLLDQVRILGPSHYDTLATRSNAAFWTGHSGDAAEALRLFRDLLPDQHRAHGRNHVSTLATRHDIAFWTGQNGDAQGALRLLRELLADRELVLGHCHPHTLGNRSDVAFWTALCGDQGLALRLFRQLLPDTEQALGPEHIYTLTVRRNIALWTGRCGDEGQALHLFQDLLPDAERALGSGHPETLRIRSNIAGLTDQIGNTAEALRLFEELRIDVKQYLGPHHPGTIATHDNIVHTGQ